jgi:endonuclease G, mitochondrial
MILTRCALLVLFCLVNPVQAANLVTLDKGGFTLTYDCAQRTALRYEYTLGRDNGNAARPKNFSLDPDLPAGCGGQLSTTAYGSIEDGWDRGHLVTSNHMDTSATYMKRANYMSNIVPQASGFNQGIWVQAENVAECYRDIAPVRVLGGVVYDDDSNDYFLKSHGIATPDYFWKVILTTDPKTGTEKAIAWYIPNTNNVDELDDYIVSIEGLENLVGAAVVNISASAAVKSMKPTRTWSIPRNCDQG